MRNKKLMPIECRDVARLVMERVSIENGKMVITIRKDDPAYAELMYFYAYHIVVNQGAKL